MGFKGVLKSMFPFIATAASLGGPLGNMAATAVGKAIGIDKVDATIDGITDAITSAQVKDPTILLKLKETEQQFQVTMAQLGYDSISKLEQIDAEDRANARAREIQVKDNTPKILAFIVVLVTLTLEGILIFHGNPPTVEGVVLGRVLGTLDTATITVLAYYFGSSSGSTAKNSVIENMAKTAGDK